MCILYSNEQMEIHESETLYNNSNPQWGSTFDFEIYNDNMVSSMWYITSDADILWFLVREKACCNCG